MTIRERIRSLIRAGEQGPAAISQRIILVLTDRERTEALSAALPYLVRDEIRKMRHDAYGDRTGERGDGLTRIAGRIDEEPVLSRPETTSQVADRAKRQREAGRAGFDASQRRREREQAVLKTPIHVHGGWKTLGECTPEDLRGVAHEQRERATENTRRAEGFERLALSLERAGARTVADYRGELREQIVGTAPAA